MTAGQLVVALYSGLGEVAPSHVPELHFPNVIHGIQKPVRTRPWWVLFKHMVKEKRRYCVLRSLVSLIISET